MTSPAPQTCPASLCFTVPGEARGKGRPRAFVRAGHARLHTDAKTASYESLVKLAAARALDGRDPFDEPLAVTIRVRLCPPASASKRKRAEMLSAPLSATRKPDIDNVVKAIFDGCNSVAYRDDVLVTRLTTEKVWADTAGVDVVILPLRNAA